MRSFAEKVKAVITADIVNSSLLDNRQIDKLKKSIENFFIKRQNSFTFYRGDSFNAVCDVLSALKSVYLLRTMAIQFSEDPKSNIDIRFAIGIGKVQFPFKDLNIAKGEAFLLSGREMDHMNKKGPRLIIRATDKNIDIGMAAIALFSDYIIRKLTIKQAVVVNELLNDLTQMQIANKLGKSQSTINKHANSADWHQLANLLELYTKLTDYL